MRQGVKTRAPCFGRVVPKLSAMEGQGAECLLPGLSAVCCVPASWELALQHSSPAPCTPPTPQTHTDRGQALCRATAALGQGVGDKLLVVHFQQFHPGLFLPPNLPQKSTLLMEGY